MPKENPFRIRFKKKKSMKKAKPATPKKKTAPKKAAAKKTTPRKRKKYVKGETFRQGLEMAHPGLKPGTDLNKARAAIPKASVRGFIKAHGDAANAGKPTFMYRGKKYKVKE